MKKICGIVALSFFVSAGAFAQSFSTVESGFQTFAGDVATSLPYASTIGLNWSWAYIGKFPHFGVGLAAGLVTIPTTGFTQVANALGIPSTLPPPLNNANLGLPLPAYVVEGRLGGFILPFDVGIKYGTIPTQANLGALLPSGTNLQFHLYGLQVRYQLVKEKFLIPSVSVGAAYNHFDGELGMPVGSAITIASVPVSSSTYDTIGFTAPQLFFNWKSNSLDATIEASKHVLLFFTPYIGAGLSYGLSSAGGGLSSQMTVNGSPATQSDVNTLNTYLNTLGQSTYDFTTTGFSISTKANGFSARAFGGLSVNIAWLKIDGTVMYNFMTGKAGVTVGTRLQF